MLMLCFCRGFSDIFDAMFAMHRHAGEVIILQGLRCLVLTQSSSYTFLLTEFQDCVDFNVTIFIIYSFICLFSGRLIALCRPGFRHPGTYPEKPSGFF